MPNPINPIATYRLQFHRGFTFKEAEKLIPYLRELGIGGIYASPIFEAVSGSEHGYDVVNPLQINPEIGTLAELRGLSVFCKAHNLVWIQDIVPNHMAFHASNRWLMDVLEKGPVSAFTAVFDTGFSSDFFQTPLMAPFLGNSLQEVITHHELKLSLDEEGKLWLTYYDQQYPVNNVAYSHLLARLDGMHHKIIKPLEEALATIASCTAMDKKLGNQAWADFFRRWYRLLAKREIRASIQRVLMDLSTESTPLLEICKAQYYRLSHWETSDTIVSYRRFFTVNDLICLQGQNEEVFKLTHRLIKELVEEEIFQGLRIDHIDGLFDPEKYVNDLRNLVGPETYIVAEKILAAEEKLPTHWLIQGTSGYDFLAFVNKLFTDQSGEQIFDKLYRKLLPQKVEVEQQLWQKKDFILRQHLQGEVENLWHFFEQAKFLSKQELNSIGKAAFKDAIAALLVYCPVYRFYANKWPLPPQEEEHLKAIFKTSREQRPTAKTALEALEDLWLKTEYRTKNRSAKQLYFYQRLMQFSGPLMAKGVEDTLMYTYNRFIGHNEVGDSLLIFNLPAKHFHALMEERQQLWPLAMNATATHDTKRGEDARARLQALSSLPKAWRALVMALEKKVAKEKGEHLPEVNDRYFIYQTLLATYPLFAKEETTYIGRLDAYLPKALREAKVHSQWASPNEVYEKKCIHFAHMLYDREDVYWPLWAPLLDVVKNQGMFNSLTQVTLKVMAPGVPDFYQGTEGWDFSFVDPDNRRAVTYKKYRADLNGMAEENATLLEYWHKRNNAGIKLWLIRKLLHYRREHAALFEKGIYKPLRVKGRYREHVLAFYRRYKQQWSVCIIPLHLAAICADQHCSIAAIHWKNTCIDWPDGMPQDFHHVLNSEKGKCTDKLLLTDLFKETLPIAVLHMEGKESARAAGVLMAVSSLPSAFGIGDLGPQAYSFITQIAEAGQHYWQLLPLNPTRRTEYHSPYSSYSVFAGNPLLISPEILYRKNLLTKGELKEFTVEDGNYINYDQVVSNKQVLLRRAFERFSANQDNNSYKHFEQFILHEKAWLDDFALYRAIKEEQQGKPWYEWPAGLRIGHHQALVSVAKRNVAAILAFKWEQYEFFEEWRTLRGNCETLAVRLLGDIPIYVHYDSIDVWRNKQLFNLDKSGNLLGIAGVPPDYFNAAGQLWGMPTFNWKRHAKDGYAWWLARLRKNLEWYDLVRLDHFRAFYDYWEVPANKSNAVEGSWKPGPREPLFNMLQQEVGKLPLVAEDLGDVSQEVYDLRNKLGFPGMHVLQFAFGEDMPFSPHIPHQHLTNSIVYTGTHDNHTVVGWFEEELGEKEKRHLEVYLGHRAKVRNIHKEMIGMAYASVAALAIIPLQDILGLGKDARMNTPATTGTNWKWRLRRGQLHKRHLHWLYMLTIFYNR